MKEIKRLHKIKQEGIKNVEDWFDDKIKKEEFERVSNDIHELKSESNEKKSEKDAKIQKATEKTREFIFNMLGKKKESLEHVTIRDESVFEFGRSKEANIRNIVRDKDKIIEAYKTDEKKELARELFEFLEKFCKADDEFSGHHYSTSYKVGVGLDHPAIEYTEDGVEEGYTDIIIDDDKINFWNKSRQEMVRKGRHIRTDYSDGFSRKSIIVYEREIKEALNTVIQRYEFSIKMLDSAIDVINDDGAKFIALSEF